MANPAVGSVVRFERADGHTFNALVLTDEGVGYVGVVYVDTTAAPAFTSYANPVPVVTPNSNGVVVA